MTTITKTAETPLILLKTVHDDIMKANPTSTLETKAMRIWLRANLREVHVHNASWVFTPAQYDVVRAQFDSAYRERLARAAKRKPAAPRKSRKSAKPVAAAEAPVADAAADAVTAE